MSGIEYKVVRYPAGGSLNTFINACQEKGQRMHGDRNLMTMMKSSFSGIFLLVVLSSIVSGLGSVVSSDYKYIRLHYTWQEAKSYCRDSGDYTDLAPIYTQSDANDLELKRYQAWIGLRKSQQDWTWLSGNSPNPNLWAEDQPQTGESCAFSYYNGNRVFGATCGRYFFFICDNPYEVIIQSKTWSEARQYCLDNNRNLASFQSRNEIVSATEERDFPVWTGLHRNETRKWSRAMVKYDNWGPGEPGNSGDCVSISSVQKEMATQNCSHQFPFICYKDNLVLIKENKTWEEALEQCRALRSPTHQQLCYELVSVQPEDYNHVMTRVMEADTEEVWTGLRFLAGEWLWVNRADMLFSDLPRCPQEVQHCGAISKNSTGSVETRDCAERKNFLCYWTQAS